MRADIDGTYSNYYNSWIMHVYEAAVFLPHALANGRLFPAVSAFEKLPNIPLARL